jgi:hypothetical protein
MSMRLNETLKLLPEARRFVSEGERLVSQQHSVMGLSNAVATTRWMQSSILNFSKACTPDTSITWKNSNGRFSLW